MTTKLPKRLCLDRLTTPIGEAMIVTDEAGRLRAFDWAGHEASMASLLRRYCGSAVPEPGAAPNNVRRPLRSYFDGDIGCLSIIEWCIAGTSFQEGVWAVLATIPPARRS